MSPEPNIEVVSVEIDNDPHVEPPWRALLLFMFAAGLGIGAILTTLLLALGGAL